jgi:hypothetical protein
MQLLKLTLRLPACLSAVDAEGDLPCTLVRLAASTLTRNAGDILARAIEEEAAAHALRTTIHAGDEEEEEEEQGAGDGEGGVFVLPLPPAHEHEPVTQLFVFGQVRACFARVSEGVSE